MFVAAAARARVLAPLCLVSALASGGPSAQTAGDESVHPWHLGGSCSTCLRLPAAWRTYGVGHPDVAVVVAERWLFDDTRAAARWHAGIAGERFQMRFGGGSLVAPQPDLPSLPDRLLNQTTGLASLDALTNKRAARRMFTASSRRGRGEALCSFVRSERSGIPRNHDLQMASLIGGQRYRGTSGVAPGTHVILTEGTLAPDEAGFLKDLIARRPDVRVVNFSQGQGRVHDATAIDSALPHALHYQKLDRLVMELSVAGLLERHGGWATRFLVVASAGNVPAFESNVFEPEEVLDARIPPEAIHFGQPAVEYVDLRPHYLRDVPRLGLPLLVVGAVGANGTLPSYGRIDQGIHLYAPAGIDWITQLRDRKPGDQGLGGAEWRECACAALSVHHPGLTVGFDLQQVCAPLKQASWAQLGVPALDFHTHSAPLAEPPTPVHMNCANAPKGVCTAIADGTSAAAALVSGVAALVFALDPTLSGEEVAQILKTTARTDNPMGLAVVDPSAALDAAARQIGSRLIDALESPATLSAYFGVPFYYALQGHDPEAFADREAAATYVADSMGWHAHGRKWHLTRIEDARVRRCGVGMAGSTLGIRQLLQGTDVCGDTTDSVELLRLRVGGGNGIKDFTADMVLRRASHLTPETHWRVAGLNVTWN